MIHTLCLLLAVTAPAPTATFRLTFPSAPKREVVVAIAVAGEKPDVRRLKPTGSATLELAVPSGRVALAIDDGREKPPFATAELELAPGKTFALPMPDRAGADVTILVRDKATGTPFPGASLHVPPDAKPRDRALAAALAARAGVSKADGVLSLGAVPNEPHAFLVEAKERRFGEVRLAKDFEAGQRETRVAAYQDVRVELVGLDLKRETKRPVAAIRPWSEAFADPEAKPAPSSRSRRQEVPLTGSVLFLALAPGEWSPRFTVRGQTMTLESVTVSDRSDAPDVQSRVGEMSLVLVRGTTKLRDGNPVEARVKALMTDGAGDEESSATASGADGVFELPLVVGKDGMVMLEAESREPRAKGHLTRGPVNGSLLDADIVLEAGVLRVRTKDALSGAPLSGCWVAPYPERSTQGEMPEKTNADGTVDLYGLPADVIRVAANCKGYAEIGETRVEFDPGTPQEVTLSLVRADELVVRVVDWRGLPVPGALVYSRPVGPRLLDFVSSYPIGTTDVQGELKVAGDRYAGRPYLVYAAGAALGIGQLPPARPCSEPSACTVTVNLSPLSPSAPPLNLHSRSGSFEPLRMMIAREGTPVPSILLREALEKSGLKGGGKWWERLPMILPPGQYLVEYGTGDFARLSTVVAGTFEIPLTQPTEITVP